MSGHVIEITSKPQIFPDFAEAWRYRWLAVALARRNIVTRYTQTILGPGWFVIQPILLTGVLTLVLGTFLKAPSDGMPYLAFAGTGTVLWTIFQRSLQEASTSLVATGSILNKVYFPRILIPISALMTAAVDFIPVCLLVIAVVIGFGLFSGWAILAVPLFVLLAVLIAFGAGLWLTVIDSYYRDVRLGIPFALQFLFYFTPVMYAASAVPAQWRFIVDVNPLAGVLVGFRWSMVAGAPAPTWFDLLWPTAVAMILLFTGLVAFTRYERIVVDHI